MEIQYQHLYKIHYWFKITGLIISGIAVLLMMVFIAIDVTSRNLEVSFIPGAYEIVQNYFMPLVVFPALAFAYGEGAFPRITLFVDRLSVRVQRIVNIFLLLIELIMYIWVMVYGFQNAITGLTDNVMFRAGGEMLPLYPFLFLVPIGFLFLTIEVALLIFKNIISIKPNYTLSE